MFFVVFLPREKITDSDNKNIHLKTEQYENRLRRMGKRIRQKKEKGQEKKFCHEIVRSLQGKDVYFQRCF